MLIILNDSEGSVGKYLPELSASVSIVVLFIDAMGWWKEDTLFPHNLAITSDRERLELLIFFQGAIKTRYVDQIGRGAIISLPAISQWDLTPYPVRHQFPQLLYKYRVQVSRGVSQFCSEFPCFAAKFSRMKSLLVVGCLCLVAVSKKAYCYGG